MQHTTRVLVEQVHSYTCDRCRRTDEKSSPEGQEYLHFGKTGGYGSVFDDGGWVGIDLCQHCLRDTLGPWLRIKPSCY